MPQELIDDIDAHRGSGESRSEYIRDAVKQRMAEEDAADNGQNGESNSPLTDQADA